MGHAYVKNLSDILLKRIYAKGKVSIEELVDHCVKNKIPLNASEGQYFEDYMIELGFSHLILFHGLPYCENNRRPNIEAELESKEDAKLYLNFKEHGLSKVEDEEDWKRFRKLKWKFTEGTRKMYIDKTIPVMYNMEN